ncbi:MAG: UDP-N-acetylenolpyruvoylglucosamine reductase [Gammaproteobacteria bacterium]|nr:UDP-N-acetylenolpyruvoylglucosamine reductase [Gammaproteobacteria bacterium]
MKELNKIKQNVKGKIKKDISLKNYNTWKVGGNAEYFYEPDNLNDLTVFLNLVKDEQVTFLGNGSNVLIRDKGIKGFVVCLKNSLNNFSFDKEGIFTFEAGLSCMKIAQISARKNFSGLEFLCGIPGTLGGALRMNAGCYGGNIWENVNSVILINKSGDLINKSKKEFNIGYRNVNLDEDSFFVSASFSLKKNELRDSRDKIKNLLQHRRISQPTGLPSCGSVFKNPDNDSAGKILDSLGLKGYRIGGAYVSQKHANFIITEKSAKSDDVEKLISFIQDTVLKEKKILLETEVKFIGEKS